MKRFTLLVAILLALIIVPSVFANHTNTFGGGAGGCIGIICYDVQVDMGKLNTKLPDNHPCYTGFELYLPFSPSIWRYQAETNPDIVEFLDYIVISWVCTQEEGEKPGYSGGGDHSGLMHGSGGSGDGNNGVGDYAPGHRDGNGASDIPHGQTGRNDSDSSSASSSTSDDSTLSNPNEHANDNSGVTNPGNATGNGNARGRNGE